MLPRRSPNSGSSPLTRGKPDRTAGPGQVLGLIPAHAGKTTGSRAGWRCPTAHPRSRGENPSWSAWVRSIRGSSPLTRGKLLSADRALSGRGLIPAHAGKTQTRAAARLTRRAHPRSRGENWAASRRWRSLSGSSPLTRGKRTASYTLTMSPWLIPAHAGKTLRSRKASARQWAHPRSRGENGEAHRWASSSSGSSPLTRGKLLRGGRRKGQHGLIPAHAGKTGKPDHR